MACSTYELGTLGRLPAGENKDIILNCLCQKVVLRGRGTGGGGGQWGHVPPLFLKVKKVPFFLS
jgi:hypothetical protein